MSRIEIRHLRTLVALRETGSLVEAAELVHLSQSALSHQLKDLEDKLQCELFVRKSKPIRFTSSGQRLLLLADEVLPAVEKSERDIARLKSGVAGRLNIAIECHSCFEWLLPTVDLFRDNWPEVELDFSAGFNFAPLPALQRGDLDLVVTSDPFPAEDLIFHPLFRYQSMLAVAKQHPLASRHWIVPDDLADQTLITYPVERERLDIFRQFLDPASAEPLQVRTAELTMMIIQLAASGRGVASLPNWALSEYTRQGFVLAKPLGENGCFSTLYAAIRADMNEHAYLQDFLATARRLSLETLDGVSPMPQAH